MSEQSLVPIERIDRSILLLREQKVMLDTDLAELYGVDTRSLIQAVQRNIDRFPADFMFQLTKEEFERLRSQTVTSNVGRGGRRYPPYAFTEQGVAMLSSVLRSRSGEHRDHAGLRAIAPDALVQPGAGDPARRSRATLRCAVQERIPGHPPADDPSARCEPTGWLQDEGGRKRLKASLSTGHSLGITRTAAEPQGAPS